METYSIGYALLATQSALLKVVTPSLRAVVIDVCRESKWFYLYFYYEGQAPESLTELWECAITEASADLGIYCDLDDGVTRLDYPQPIPFRGQYAYLRKEPNTPLPTEIESAGTIAVEIKNFKDNIGEFVCPVTYKKMNTTWGAIYRRHMIPARPMDHPIQIVPAAYALLAVLKALLGKTTPELRAIFVDACKETHTFDIQCYYHGDIPGQLIALWKLVVAEAAAAMGPEYRLNGNVQRLDFPQRVPSLDRCAYFRYEPEQYEGSSEEWL